MLLLVGLGNPGKTYAGNRHNIGFMAIDAIARLGRFPAFRSRFQGLSSEGPMGSERAILLQPTTYMNESGRSVAEAVKFFKIPLENIIVFHDELDLPAAKLRMKAGGGHGGHNGLRSISSHLGDGYRRVRLGIGHPGNKDMVHDYVLKDFSKSEMQWVDRLCDEIGHHIALLAEGRDAQFQNKIHLSMDAAGFGEPKKKADGEKKTDLEKKSNEEKKPNDTKSPAK